MFIDCIIKNLAIIITNAGIDFNISQIWILKM